MASLISFIKEKDDKINAKTIDRNFVKINTENLYCSKYEVSNSEYRKFLNDLIKNKQIDLYKKCIYDSTMWTVFFKKTHNESFRKTYHWHPAYNNYPIVNVDYYSAQEYCKWLTGKYNSISNKKYKKVIFKLPSEKEWLLASQTYPDGKLPWYGDKGYDNKKIYMSNIKYKRITPEGYNSDYISDKAFFMTLVGKFPPNEIGIYDIIGNVSEMINEEHKAKGGNWNSFIEECFVDKTQEYNKCNPEVGFRVFMEIIEE